ncbi:UBP1 interacting protein 2a [Cryptosporidium ryanae]|uniref:UBP1 interacting protein 2a n=1 Tax=Cryptosporidium ryanae TaxID=515981 RepID=UPI003519EF45|nr:UBP1 interacting protein 2a [Cryptosporidium ryanae]
MKKLDEKKNSRENAGTTQRGVDMKKPSMNTIEFLTGDKDFEDDEIIEYRNVVSLLSKEQLVDILSKSAYVFRDIGSACKLIVERSPVSRRVMVRNISFQTTDRVFLSLFEKFGEIEDSTIIREKNGRSRGYGFVTYKSSDSIKKLFNENLVLNGRQLLVKLAADPFSEFTSGPMDCSKMMDSNCHISSNIFKKKLFIRNLSENTTSESLRRAFSEFEDIEECFVMRDHHTGKSRRYGFITFNNLSDMMKVLQHPERIVDGKVTFVSLALKQKDNSNNNASNKRSEIGSNGYHSGSNYPSFPTPHGYFVDYYNSISQVQPPEVQNANVNSDNIRNQHQHQVEVYPYVNQCYYSPNTCFAPYLVPYAATNPPYGIYSSATAAALYSSSMLGNSQEEISMKRDR